MKEFHIFTGRLVKDAEKREINESVVFNFTIAVDNGYTDRNGEWINQTKYIDCSFWRNKKSEAGIKYASERLLKGNLVQVVSKDISARAYQERENGQPKINDNGEPVLRTVLTIRVSDIEYFTAKNRNNSENTANVQPTGTGQIESHSQQEDQVPEYLPF